MSDAKSVRSAGAVRWGAPGICGLHFANFRPLAADWRPAINVYTHRGSIDVCFDLAGVRGEDSEVTIEVHRVTTRGGRPIPRQIGDSATGGASQILHVEIENGPMTRAVELPRAIDPASTSARQESGLLWLHLKLAECDGES